MGSVPIFILAAHILSMLGFATFAALLPELRDLWRLSNVEAGVIGGMFFAGYIATVSYWTALTDRHDGRDRKSTRLNSSHLVISYAVFCLKKKKNRQCHTTLNRSSNLHLQCDRVY